MGKPAAVREKASRPEPAHWPFDPLQPGGHEPVRLPEEVERVQKQTGAGRDAGGGNVKKGRGR